MSLELDGSRRVRNAQVVLGQVAPTPWTSTAAAEALIGQVVDSQTAETAGLAAVEEANPLSQNGYKVQLAKVAVQRAILRAAGLETPHATETSRVHRLHDRRIEEWLLLNMNCLN